jgi:nucleoid-associated protein YgaU
MEKGVVQMTADAKIGLLLGLFFIVLIAYLINGLPSFLQSAAAEDVVKTTSVVTPSTPDLVIDRQLTETAWRLSPDIPLRKTEPPQEVIILNSIPQEAAAPNPVAGDIPIPPAPTPSVISEQINQLDLPSTGRTTTQPAAREHIVQRGENLAVIAQKYYGPEQGNRRAVIQKLYEANKEAMSSPDHVVVGSRLVIPPLTDSAATVRTEPPATESLLERFSNFFERTNSASTTSHAAKPQPKTVQYVVQPGDSLWKIAEKTLGDGNKYKDLLDLNKDRLKSADDLKAGMTLILPAR